MLRNKTQGQFVWMASGLLLFAVQPGLAAVNPGACCTNGGCEVAYYIGGGVYCCNGICQTQPFGGSCNRVCCLVNGQYVSKPQVCCYTGTVSGQDCDGSGFDDRCEPDCNHDGKINACEDNPAEQDCDGDGVCNGVEIAACPGCDCNTNGLPDDCEAWDPWFTTKSKHQPFYYQSTPQAIHRINSAPAALPESLVYVSFRTKADLEAANELVNVYLGDGLSAPSVGVAYEDASGVSCGIYNDWLTVTANDFNDSLAANGGSAIFRMDPTSYVGNTCYGSFMQVTVSYLTANDCDYNSVPDVCDPDCDGDDVPNFCEIRDCPPGNPGCADCNGNEVQDDCDISSGTSDDCQDVGETGHGIPDECDADCDVPNDGVPNNCEIRDCPPGNPSCTDCQPNLIPDHCDIEAGTSLDCQAGTGDAGDGSPDECDLTCAGGQSWCSDCNANGIPDNCDPDCDNDDVPNSCEIATCPACNSPGCKDCNGNGVPDACEITADPNLDCLSYPAGRNGIPDSCEADNNANGVADSCDLASGAHPDCDQDGVPDDAQDAAEAAGSRYLAIRLPYGKLPDGQSPPVATSTYALGVTPKATWSCGRRFVQDSKVLGTTPVYKTPAQWCALGVNVRGDIIIPSTQYTVEAFLLGSTVPILLGNPFTHMWGDVSGPRAASDCPWGPPDEWLTQDDCDAMLARYSSQSGAPPLTRADIIGPSMGGSSCTPANGVVNFSDISMCLSIVNNGAVYPCPDPCSGGSQSAE